jgi:D-glycero-D-manno-heptose 1,7-bisphosphate phosphatase
VARGTQSRAEVDAINAFLASQLPIDAFYVCCHDNADHCDCRKPKPGMLIRAASERGIDLSRSFMVGDRSGDILAGAAAGCRTFLIDLPYSKGDCCSPDARVADLSEAARQIIQIVRAGN